MHPHRHRGQHHKRHFNGPPNLQKINQRRYPPHQRQMGLKSQIFLHNNPHQSFYPKPSQNGSFDRPHGHRGHHGHHGPRGPHEHGHHGYRYRDQRLQKSGNEIYSNTNSFGSLRNKNWQFQTVQNERQKEDLQAINRELEYQAIIESLRQQVNLTKIQQTQSKIPSNPQNEDPPQQFMCPISQQVMKNPTIITVCGHSFQQNILKQWIAKNPMCPICKKVCKITDLQKNYGLKAVIDRCHK